jgi:hypothetical protein
VIEEHTVVHEEWCCEDCAGIPVTLRYDRGDPFAVTVVVEQAGEEPNVWLFARELFVAGMYTRVGLGDVQVWPLDAYSIAVAVSSADGSPARVACRLRLDPR